MLNFSNKQLNLFSSNFFIFSDYIYTNLLNIIVSLFNKVTKKTSIVDKKFTILPHKFYDLKNLNMILVYTEKPTPWWVDQIDVPDRGVTYVSMYTYGYKSLWSENYNNLCRTPFYADLQNLRNFFLKNLYPTGMPNLNNILKRSFGFGFYYIQGTVFLLFIDACLTDDEPLWEPIEWSMVQSWILIIFAFAWIAENLIVSRYGSYTGRDKRVWLAWYKTFWLIEGYYVINYGIVCLFVIVPFYFETNYSISFVYSWWHWYSRVFFFKFIFLFSIILYLSYFLQINIRWMNWKKGLFVVILINTFLSYLIYVHFFMVFFGYLTDPIWYQKVRPIDYIQMSHEPARWGWGSAKKDHFTYHNVKTVIWFKNDGPFATSFLLFHMFFFLCIFMLYFFWISLFRRIYSTNEIPLTFTTYCVSSLKQFFYFFLFFFILIFTSYCTNLIRLPYEFSWLLVGVSWSQTFVSFLIDYPYFILNLLLPSN